jgi:hypothetical protein
MISVWRLYGECDGTRQPLGGWTEERNVQALADQHDVLEVGAPREHVVLDLEPPEVKSFYPRPPGAVKRP